MKFYDLATLGVQHFCKRCEFNLVKIWACSFIAEQSNWNGSWWLFECLDRWGYWSKFRRLMYLYLFWYLCFCLYLYLYLCFLFVSLCMCGLGGAVGLIRDPCYSPPYLHFRATTIKLLWHQHQKCRPPPMKKSWCPRKHQKCEGKTWCLWKIYLL